MSRRKDLTIIKTTIGLYLTNQYIKNKISIKIIRYFMCCYFNDIIGGITFTAYCNLLFIFHNKKITKLWQYELLLLFAGLFWEYLTPLFRKDTVSDMWDIVAYMTGGIIYWLIQSQGAKKTMKKFKNKVRTFFKKHYYEIMLLIIIIFIPIIIGLIYALPFKQVIYVDSSDVLSFYGTAGGIYVSFIVYRNEQKKKRKTRNKELKPVFTVRITKTKDDLFTLKVNKLSQKPVRYVYYYDMFINEHISTEEEYRITYLKSVNEEKKLNPDYNFTMDSDIIDKQDGYPKYFQLICDDIDGNAWNLEYNKAKDGNSILYYPSQSEIIA